MRGRRRMLMRFDGRRVGRLFHGGLFFVHGRIITRMKISCIPRRTVSPGRTILGRPRSI
jgi:hypothetical protein